MKKRLIILGIVILITIAGFNSIIAKELTLNYNKTNNLLNEPTGNTLYVGGGGPNNYSYIQNAIDDASSGDTIFVYNGTYHEYLEIDYPNLNLVGEDKNSTVIRGYGFFETIYIKSNSGHVNISGFKITNSGNVWDSAGILIFWASNNCITNNIITKNKGNGISLIASDSNLITNNLITENQGQGIRLDSHDNTISYNQIEKNKNGIYYYVDYDMNGKNTIASSVEMGNDILNNLITSNFCSGINEIFQSGDIILDNIITNNKVGIELTDCNVLDIIKNTISENDIGINTTGFYNFQVRIKKNEITDNRLGICISNNTDGYHEIYHNNIVNNQICSLYIENSSKNRIHHNNFKDSKWGLLLINSSFTRINNNNFINCDIKTIHSKSHFNLWYRNYWNRPRIIPKIIFGFKGETIVVPWFQFDILTKILPNKI